jgi:hypothetical protein
VKHNNCADFQEWVTSNSLDGVEDDMFEESEFQNIMVKWDSSDEDFVGFYDQYNFMLDRQNSSFKCQENIFHPKLAF